VDLSIRCDGCGSQFSVDGEFSDNRIDCPDCGLSCKVPTHRKKIAKKRKDPSPVVPEPLNGEDHYLARRATNNFKPVYHQWDTGPTLGRRVRLFILTQLVIQPLLITGLIWPDLPWGGDNVGLLFPALCGSILLLVLLGTFDRTSLYRNSLGDVHLTKHWRVGFIPMSVYEVPLSKFDKVRMVVSPAETGDWLLMVALLIAGIVPGIVWYFKVMLRPNYRVVLSGGAHDDEVVYRGPDHARAEELGRSIAEMTEKQFDRV
jgi:hypothetical protein